MSCAEPKSAPSRSPSDPRRVTMPPKREWVVATVNGEAVRSSEVLGQVLGTLARGADLQARSLEDILAGIAETAARTLRVVRVNIWLYEPDRSGIRCIEGYDTRTNQHESGEVLYKDQFPSYFHALDLLRTIAAMDAESDSRTEELTEGYLRVHGITTMLDVPLLRSGNVVGVICHEHAGAPRKWTEVDRLFAGSVGDLVSLVLETARTVEAERERAQLAEQLERRAHVEGVGNVTAAVAHDFRNLLTAVYAHASAIAGQPSAGDVAESASAILSAAKQANDLCEELLVCSGSRPNAQEEVALGAVVEDVARVVRATMPRGVGLEVDVEPSSPRVVGDVVALHRMVMNVVVNAIDAIGDREGRILVRVRAQDPDLVGDSEGLDFRPKPYPCVMVEVEDDGPGMDPALRRRIFEPFLTTKPNGHGLGLAIVLGTVRGHGGAVAVRSRPDEGTRVDIWLPSAG